MMAGVRIDNPLLSRNIVEIFDIIESVSAELEEQRKVISKLFDMLARAKSIHENNNAAELLFCLQESERYCEEMLTHR